ncbi:MAG: hypothetical protein V3R65_08795 [Acidiferrobacterales bacterium]
MIKHSAGVEYTAIPAIGGFPDIVVWVADKPHIQCGITTLAGSVKSVELATTIL